MYLENWGGKRTHKRNYGEATMHRMPYKLQVAFRKRATNHRALLRKMNIKDKAFL